ncbi:MAG: hypothetical protein ACR2PX_01240 [Endozoicomonas sp.]|uniref:hypothetical protein n=1 Tax=Endozoicomonas sp. TaxID=1892382 RepID=UPI003D9AC48D
MQKILGFCLSTVATLALADSTLTPSFQPSNLEIKSEGRLSDIQIEHHLLVDRDQFKKAQETFNSSGTWSGSRDGWLPVDQMTLQLQGKGSTYILCTRVPINHLRATQTLQTAEGLEYHYTFKGVEKLVTWKFWVDVEQTLAHCSSYEINGQKTSYLQLLNQPPDTPSSDTLYSLNIHYGQPITEATAALTNAVLPGMLQCAGGRSKGGQQQGGQQQGGQQQGGQSSGGGFWKWLCCWSCSSGETTTPDKAGQTFGGGQEPPPPPSQGDTEKEPTSVPDFDKNSEKGKLKVLLKNLQGQSLQIEQIAQSTMFSGNAAQWVIHNLDVVTTMGPVDGTFTAISHLASHSDDMIDFLSYITDEDAKTIRNEFLPQLPRDD